MLVTTTSTDFSSSTSFSSILNEKDRKTPHRIESNMERWILIIWTFIVFLSSVIGDSIILISTIKYQAIKLHKVSVVIMQHLAVCDIFLAVIVVLPICVTLKTDNWMLGKFLGNVGIHVQNMCFVSTVLLNCAMAITKLIYLKQPLHAAGWTSRFGHRICASMWSLTLCIYLPIIVGSLCSIMEETYLNYISYTLSYRTDRAPVWLNWYTLVCSSLVILIPCSILAVTSILIFMVAQKAATRHNERIRREGTVAVLLTVAVFFVSFLPNCVIDVAWNVGIGPSQFDDTLLRTTYFLTYFNTLANFYVYSLTVRSFRLFLKGKILKLLRFNSYLVSLTANVQFQRTIGLV